jgi:hypothetical protein
MSKKFGRVTAGCGDTSVKSGGSSKEAVAVVGKNGCVADGGGVGRELTFGAPILCLHTERRAPCEAAVTEAIGASEIFVLVRFESPVKAASACSPGTGAFASSSN